MNNINQLPPGTQDELNEIYAYIVDADNDSELKEILTDEAYARFDKTIRMLPLENEKLFYSWWVHETQQYLNCLEKLSIRY